MGLAPLSYQLILRTQVELYRDSRGSIVPPPVPPLSVASLSGTSAPSEPPPIEFGCDEVLGDDSDETLADVPMPGRWQTIPIVGEAVRDLFLAEQVPNQDERQDDKNKHRGGYNGSCDHCRLDVFAVRTRSHLEDLSVIVVLSPPSIAVGEAARAELELPPTPPVTKPPPPTVLVWASLLGAVLGNVVDGGWVDVGGGEKDDWTGADCIYHFQVNVQQGISRGNFKLSLHEVVGAPRRGGLGNEGSLRTHYRSMNLRWGSHIPQQGCVGKSMSILQRAAPILGLWGTIEAFEIGCGHHICSEYQPQTDEPGDGWRREALPHCRPRMGSTEAVEEGWVEKLLLSLQTVLAPAVK
ncbi:hypothetical protein B0H13DRAFT_1904379 [Mycena leptocephala]|nr:hypothetical protein B0H13DRAFT_1904379 [Mycena leptocephala]